MKYSTLIAALPLLQLTAAQPHRRRHAHEHKLIRKDGDMVVTIVHTVYAKATDSPQVIVYVDQDGMPVTTITEGVAAVPTHPPPPPPAPPVAPAPAPPVAPAPPAPPVAPAPAPPAAPAPPTPPAPPVAPAPAPVVPDPAPVISYPAAPEPVKASAPPASPPTYSGGEETGFGLVYSPYKANGNCKSLAEVQEDFKSISSEYKLIRIYGTDCEQVANILTVIKARKNKLFAGIFNLANLESQVDTIVAAANGDWSHFDTVCVGNELVNSGAADAATVVEAIGKVRGLLKAAGYTGSVVTVDTLVASRANPILCDASDYCAVNCHAYFDGNVAAADSGNFLTTQIPTLREKLANKNQKLLIAETGWPWKGLPNKAAVASIANQAAAISSIKESFASNPEGVILFTAFNDMWKKNTRFQFEAEQYWGMGGTNPPSG